MSDPLHSLLFPAGSAGSAAPLQFGIPSTGSGGHQLPNYNDINETSSAAPSTPGLGSDYDFSDSESDVDSDSGASTLPSLNCPLALDDRQEKQLSFEFFGSTRGARLATGSPSQLENQPHELDAPRELVAATEIKDSYFEARVRHVEFATWGETWSESARPACLIVLEINFQPRLGGSKPHRFSDASIEVEFEDAPTFTSDTVIYRNNYENGRYMGPVILKFAPTLVQGAPTTGQQTTSFGVSVSIDPGSIVPGLTIPTPPLLGGLSYKNTTVAPKTGATLIHGVLRSDPPRRVVWSISENEVEKGGIPRRVRLAMVVGYSGSKRFSMKVGMKAHLVGWKGLWPVKAVHGGYKDAPVYFNPGKMMQSGIGVGENAERSRKEVLELGPAVQAHEPEVVAEMAHLMGGSISIRHVVHKKDVDGPQEQPSRDQAGGDHEWQTWLPKGSLKSTKSFESGATVVEVENASLRDLRDVDVVGLTKRSPKRKV